MNNISNPKIVNTREELLDLLPKNISIAEIGVFKGDFSKIIYEKIKPSCLYLVDFFDGHMGSGDKNGENFEVVNLAEQYELLKKYFEKDPNVKIVKSTSWNFLNYLPENSLDAIYIDADHSYEAVKGDLNLCFSKVKNGGFIMGHDYNPTMFPSVIKAVAEFCLENGQKLEYITKDGCPSFLIIKTIS